MPASNSSRPAIAFVIAALCCPAMTVSAAEKASALVTSALDFKTTVVCTATNVSSTPVNVTIELLSPQSGERLYNSTVTTATLQPGFGTANAYVLQVGYTSAYCKVTHNGSLGSVRAAACAKADVDGGCVAVSEAR